MCFSFSRREYYRNQGGGYGDNGNFGKQGHPRNGYYPPRSNRALAIILPIVGILVIAGAVLLVFMFYKKNRNTQSTSRASEKYSGKFFKLKS